jgi:signal transduction histidine kinase
MKLELTSFRTKVARRIFVLFIICAILPISVLALVSFIHVKGQLHDQSQNRLRQEGKAIGMAIIERLLFIRAEMKLIASNISSRPGKLTPTLPDSLTENLKERFRGLAVFTEKGNYTPLFGRIKSPPELISEEKEYTNSGKAILRHQVNPGSDPIIFMWVAVDLNRPSRGVLVAEINSIYLWEAAEGRPHMTDLFVLDRSKNILFSSLPGSVSFPNHSLEEMTRLHTGHFEWRHKTKEYFASYWSIFLKANFFSPDWIVVLSESKEDVLAPMAEFKKAFQVIIILSIGMVFLLSIGLIRRNMVPIEILREATRKIAQGAFGHRIEIRSGDEFESLGRSFNKMSSKLKEGQALLVKAAKLSTMGQMAGGVVHEINQPLTAIYGLLELSLLSKPPDDNRKHIETALESVKRLNAILTRFKSFSHMSESAMENLSIKQTIDQVYRLLEHQLGMKQIRCEIENKENLPFILGDHQGLQQVFSNLLINAMHALENKKDDQRILNIRTYSSEDTLFVEIQDNGCGIPEEIQNRIFEPFFTTKDADKGTGLGMAIIESILHKHHAKIEVESEVGIGTRFTIAFPASRRVEGQVL